MVTLFLIIILMLATLPALAARAGRVPAVPHSDGGRAARAASVNRTATASPDEEITPWTEPDNEDGVDLYGNGVSDAVARYRLDSGGTLYELHSPRTEVPRLSAPKG